MLRLFTKTVIALVIAFLTAVTLALVTVTVTRADEGYFQVVMYNHATGGKYPWARKTFANPGECRQALGNLNEVLAAVAKLETDKSPIPDVRKGTDEDLVEGVQEVLNFLIQATGKAPDVHLECEPAGQPA